MTPSRMVLAQVHGNFGRKDAQKWFQKRHLLVEIRNEKKIEISEVRLAIYTLKSTAGWHVNVITIRTK
jgi:hypothetical protein